MPLLAHFLTGNRRALLWYAVGMVGVCLSYLPLYPVFGADELANIYAQMPESVRVAFGVAGPQDGAGYAHSTVFGLVGSLLFIIATLTWGARAVAGDEEAGTLELTLSHAVTRSQVVLERGLALALYSVALAAVLAAVTLASSGPFELGLEVVPVLAESAAVAALGFLFGLVGMAMGAVTGRGGLAVGVGAALALAAYVGIAVGAQVEGLGWLAGVSPFDWAFGEEPIRNGFDLRGLGLLAAASLASWAVAVWGLARRDVGRA